MILFGILRWCCCVYNSIYMTPKENVFRAKEKKWDIETEKEVDVKYVNMWTVYNSLSLCETASKAKLNVFNELKIENGATRIRSGDELLWHQYVTTNSTWNNVIFLFGFVVDGNQHKIYSKIQNLSFIYPFKWN